MFKNNKYREREIEEIEIEGREWRIRNEGRKRLGIKEWRGVGE